VLALPKGKDPDELIRSEADAWPIAVESARPVVDHLIAVVSSGLDLAEPRDRSTLVAEVLPAIGDVLDPVLRAHYLQRLSRLARVSEEALRLELPRRGRQRTSASPALVPGTTTTVVKRAATASKEAFALALLYNAPSLRSLGENLDEAIFSMSENRELFRRWRDEQLVLEDEGVLFEHYQTVMTTRIPVNETEQVERAFLDCVERLRRYTIRTVKEASALALAEGEAGVRPGQVASIARARLGAGTTAEQEEDEEASAVASQLLEDMEAGLRFHRRLIEGYRPDHTGSPSAE
jgi:DNA primase